MAEQVAPPQDGGSNPTPPLQKHEWLVEALPMSTARDLVEKYHYSHTSPYPFGVETHGLFRRQDSKVFGTAWWHLPPYPLAAQLLPENHKAVISLSRLVIVPDTPKNAASFLLRHSIGMLKKAGRWKCLVTFADTWQEHTGAIYRASGWVYLGLTTAKEVWLDSKKNMVARKYGGKFYTKQEMAEQGYTLLGKFAKHKFVLYI